MAVAAQAGTAAMAGAHRVARPLIVAVVLLTPFLAHLVLAHELPPWPARIIAAGQLGTLAWAAVGLVVPGRWTRGLSALAVAVIFLLAGSGQTSIVVATAVMHATLYVGLTLLFGLSLRPGQEPLISRVARRVEPCPTPALMAYARGVTWLWAGFGLAQLTASALLLLLAPRPVWSTFVNLLDGPLIAATFAAEYGVRRWRFRHMRLATLTETIRAFIRRDAP